MRFVVRNRIVLVGLCWLVLRAIPALGQANASPTFPEEARKHFVMGETMFKEAKAPGDFVLAEGEFKQATDLAPEWPDARYDLALAKEAAGDYSGAMEDLKLYQQFKLTDVEARTVQDKIYTIEAKQQLKASDATAKAAADAANAQAEADSEKNAFIKSIQGSWVFFNRTFPSKLSISPLGNGNVNITYQNVDLYHGNTDFQISDIRITGSTLQFVADNDRAEYPEKLDHYTLSLDSQGRLRGSTTSYLTESGKAMVRRLGIPYSDGDHMDAGFNRQ
jgi:hypothetical protein